MVRLIPSVLAVASMVGSAVAISALSVGRAIVINQCPYTVYLNNIPSAYGGHPEENATLVRGSSYSQQYTQLDDNAGWSIKLSNRPGLEDLLQYEYTFNNTGDIYYDLSEVNKLDWFGHWKITSDIPTCLPKQVAYQFPTDDPRSMQACTANSTITVTLCHGLPLPDNGLPSPVSSLGLPGAPLPQTSSLPAYSASSIP